LGNKLAEALKKLPKHEQVQAKRMFRIALSKNNFWLFCKSIAPDFYKETRPHLKVICDTLQALYEKRIWKPSYLKMDEYGKGVLRPQADCEWTIAPTAADVPEDAYVCKNFKMHIPPRHGKSRTLILFECWCFGQNHLNSVITVSYNALIAEEFSRFVRDEIQKDRRPDSDDIVFSDVFPEVQIKEDDASVTKWSLKGSHFSYLGTGMGGSTTSKGATIQVVDDPVKDSEVASNEVELNAQADWFNNTFLSRTDAEGGESIVILNMTRWATKDLAGIIDSDMEQRDMWYTLLMPVMNEETGEMLCEDILNRSKYYVLKNSQSTSIFRANYFQEPIDVQGRLYSGFDEYTELPDNVVRIRAECDPADTGKDYLCMIVYAETSDKLAYVLDIIYNNNKIEVTEPLMASSIVRNKVSKLIMESNNGGRLMAKNLKSRLENQMGWYRTLIEANPTTSSQNKNARIKNMAEQVQLRIKMPKDWSRKYDIFYKDVFKYVSGGKNAHDDGPDCLTRVAERLIENIGIQPVNRGVIPNPTQVDYKKFTHQPVIRVARVIRR
jgi:predicted phage terminase large subunit-like protein